MIKNCPMRHENGNCIPAGGFCTANKNICEALLNAYRMGKAQLSQEGTTSDLISRQAALKALRKCQTYLYDARDPELKIKLSSAKAAINNLPTIQPVETDTNVGSNSEIPNSSDAVSRQAAIDVIEDYPHGNVWNVESMEGMVDKIKTLPTVQPEPKEGHWIKHTDPFDGEQYECSECGVLWEFNDGTPEDNEAYFCPKCGIKMKGVSNERTD